jgi:hypothetical protein
MRRRGGTNALGQVREDRTPAAPAPAVASVGAPEAARTPDAFEEVVRFGGERGAHIMEGYVLAEAPRGVHVREDDPFLSVERRALHAPVEERALHAMKRQDLDSADLSMCNTESTPLAHDVSHLSSAVEVGAAASVRRAAHARTRRTRPVQQGAHRAASRRWGLVPVAGAAGALVVGLGGGAAFAFFSGGPATGHVSTGSPVTLDAVATTGPADLLPGDAGAVYFTVHNANSFGAIFAQVASGATVVSDDTGLCPSSDVSIARSLPYTFSPAITVSPGSTRGSQSISGFVKLAPNAPGTCQGVSFTVTLELSGQSS